MDLRSSSDSTAPNGDVINPTIVSFDKSMMSTNSSEENFSEKDTNNDNTTPCPVPLSQGTTCIESFPRLSVLTTSNDDDARSNFPQSKIQLSAPPFSMNTGTSPTQRHHRSSNRKQKLMRALFLIRKRINCFRMPILTNFQSSPLFHEASTSNWMQFPSVDNLFRASMVATMVVGWYILSLTLTAVNKILLDSLAFPYPVFVTFVHTAGVALCTQTISRYCRSQPPLMVSSTTYLTIILPIALCTSAEIALSNEAYSLVSLSVMTAVKSTLVAATYAASIVFGLEKFRISLSVILVWIIGSVALSVPGMEIQSIWGLFSLVFAVIFAAIRWVLIHRELQKTSLKVLAPFDFITIIQPLSALCLLPAALVFDTPDLLENLRLEPVDSQRICSILLLLVGAIGLVCCLLWCEFKLIEMTSSLTLTVAGVGKECATVAMSRVVFKESLQPRAVIGLVLSILGITAYGIVRNRPQKDHIKTQESLRHMSDISSDDTTIIDNRSRSK